MDFLVVDFQVVVAAFLEVVDSPEAVDSAAVADFQEEVAGVGSDAVCRTRELNFTPDCSFAYQLDLMSQLWKSETSSFDAAC